MEPRIVKIYRRNSHEMEISWQEEIGLNAVNVLTLRSPERGRLEFYSALNDLKWMVFDMLQLPYDWEDATKVVRVDIEYEPPTSLAAIAEEMVSQMEGKAPKRLVMITIERDLENVGKVKIKTPKASFSAAVMTSIDKVCREAWLYVEGERSQLSLFNQLEAA